MGLSSIFQEYFQELESMQKNQKQTNESLRKGYDHAKEVVKKLREKNCTLKTDLKNEQNKNLQLEEQLSKLKDMKLNEPSPRHDNAAQEDQDNPVQVKSLEEEVKRLESEKDTLELNNSKLQEHISKIREMRETEQVRFFVTPRGFIRSWLPAVYHRLCCNKFSSHSRLMWPDFHSNP